MLFYKFDLLDNFIQDNLIIQLKSEKKEISRILTLYDNKKSNLLAITDNMLEMTYGIEESKLDYFHEMIDSIKQSFENINDIENLSTTLMTILNETISLYDKSLQNNREEIKANFVEYNKKKDELSNKILDFEEKNTIILNSIICLSLDVQSKKIKKLNSFVKENITKTANRIDIEIEPKDNNLLIVSEKDQKAYLPFFYSEVKDIYNNSNNKYETLQDVVDNLYVVPLSKFKNSSISRFRESFFLVKNKAKGSITKALDLGLELMFRYDLNPVVIAACRNLDELDIYLDCLEENELYDFSCFEIKFEIMPQLAKQN
ncbi:MAG: hypothetical protein HFJ36_02915 [Clostridia bacterium]|nr:hypothetical protein [Clostridia bacterium]